MMGDGGASSCIMHHDVLAANTIYYVFCQKKFERDMKFQEDGMDELGLREVPVINCSPIPK